jgi:hypothetical protein
MQVRQAIVEPATYNADENTVEVQWTTGARVQRMDWWTGQAYEEELDVSASAVDMSRFEAGTLQVLDGHRTSGGVGCILGVATRGWIENGQGRAVLKLSQDPAKAGTVADIRAGIIRAVSFGYSVQRYEITKPEARKDGGKQPLYRATRWTPQEISFVTVPADANASTRAIKESSQPCEFIRADEAPYQVSQEHLMTQAQTTSAAAAANADPVRDAAAPGAIAPDSAAEAVAQAAQRAADITDLCTRHGLPQLAAGLIRTGGTLDQARAAVLDELARRDAAQGGHRNVGSVQTVVDAQDVQLRGIEEAINHRLDARVKLGDNGRQYRGYSLLEIGREYLTARGVETRGMDRMRLATELLTFRSPGLHGTSDFASLMANVANKRLRTAYDENAGTYGIWARRAPNAPDFKSINVTALSGAPDLLQTNEAGEFRYGTMRDGATTYSVVTYGRIVALSRQAIVNDDLRGFDRLVAAFGNASRRLENRTVYSILTTNAAISLDGVALFSGVSGNRTQSNVQTGAGSALQLSSLNTGRAAMRVMRGLNGEELNVVPAYLIVPAALEHTAYQFTSSSFVPALPGSINEYREGGRTALTPVVEPLLDANSTTQWYLAANSSQIDTVEYCYLDGAEGPVIESDVGFEVDGVSYKCRLDFGAAAIDFRGLHRATGA